MANKSLFLPSNSSILFVTFSRWDKGVRTPTSGSLQPLRDYLVPRIKKLVLVDQVHPSGEGVMPVLEEYRNKSKKPKTIRPAWYIRILTPWLSTPHTNPHGTYIRFKIRDFLSVFDAGLRGKTVYDYCICLESVNTIAALFLKKLGRVRKVVYYVSDYSPARYPNKLFNAFYLALDRYCAIHADYIWDVSPAMQVARIEAGLNAKKSAPVVNVPNGLYKEQIKSNSSSRINKEDLIYMGILSQDNGPDVAIKALPLVKKKFPHAKLHIIGGSEKDYGWLAKIVKKLKIEKSVIRHGFIESGVEMSKIIRGCGIGLAPYRAIPGSIRYYADAGKIRAYCASGLPVVSSQVPPLGLFIAKKNAALIAQDNPKSFADAIVRVLSDKKLYVELKRNAIIFGKHNTWDNSFKNAFKAMKYGKT